jgi:hypothetical protein
LGHGKLVIGSEGNLATVRIKEFDIRLNLFGVAWVFAAIGVA